MTQAFFCDIGNVLLYFDREKAYNQISLSLGLTPTALVDLIERESIHTRFESGQMTTEELYDTVCSASPQRPSFEVFTRAWSDIFSLNESIEPIISYLKRSGIRLILLSNISQLHWEWVQKTYSIFDPFDDATLSFEVEAMKPSKEIFEDALKRAACEPSECFYIDDIPEYTEAAKNLGIDAIQYVETPLLLKELIARKL